MKQHNNNQVIMITTTTTMMRYKQISYSNSYEDMKTYITYPTKD